MARRQDRILDIVVEILKSQGYDAVQPREVARRARTSLATTYKRYPTREQLILAALECWMGEDCYAGLVAQMHNSDAIVPAAMAVLGNADAALVKDLDTVVSSPGSQRCRGTVFAVIAAVSLDCFPRLRPLGGAYRLAHRGLH